MQTLKSTLQLKNEQIVLEEKPKKIYGEVHCIEMGRATANVFKLIPRKTKTVEHICDIEKEKRGKDNQVLKISHERMEQGEYNLLHWGGVQLHNVKDFDMKNLQFNGSFLSITDTLIDSVVKLSSFQ